MTPISLPPINTIVIHWNDYSFQVLERRLRANRFSINNFSPTPHYSSYQFRAVLFVHPFLRCANHWVPGTPNQCISFIQDLVEKHQPKNIFTLQTGGALLSGSAQLNKLYKISQVRFGNVCLPVRGSISEGLSSATMIYTNSYVSGKIKPPLCGQDRLVMSSNSLSIPWLQRKGVIKSSTNVEVILAVTDMDGHDAKKAHTQYLRDREQAAEILVSHLWEKIGLKPSE